MPAPRILLLPGWLNSDTDHWQSRWERQFGYQRVDQADWQWPRRGDWMARLDEVLLSDERPTILVAHSLGCQLVASWAEHSQHTGRVVAATPFFARLVETALREVDRGIIEATQAMGASTRQIITSALLPEARPGIFAAITVTSITLVSYTAMAGVVGAGGLGDLAIRFGYQRFQTDVMIVTVVLLLILVQILQTVGDRLVVHFSRK